MQKATVTAREQQLNPVAEQGPTVAIISPFEPKMSIKSELDSRIKQLQYKVENELLAAYPGLQSLPVLNRLTSLIARLNYSTYRKSIALFASASAEKLMYLDIEVEETVVINGSFHLRDLLEKKKNFCNYLVLHVSNRWAKLYYGNERSLLRVRSIVENPACKTSFFKYVDQGLTDMLKAYPYPVFVIGTKSVTTSYIAESENAPNIVDVLQGSFENAREWRLHDHIRIYFSNWEAIRRQYILQLVKARGIGGIDEVQQAVSMRRGRLLVVEKDYQYAVKPVVGQRNNELFFIKDSVDDIIAQMLESGGDAELVEEGALRGYQHIALV